MSYSFELSSRLDKALQRLNRRDPVLHTYAQKKIIEIVENPLSYKNLKSPLQHLRRIHLGSFVLTFSVDETKKSIFFRDLDHHDSIYR
ncbi:MAG: addiction module toxin RelE [Nanoarchaeota archaeon]|nr:addiction module toxin RelE [Nanoarchaeota archaeon]